MENTNDSPNPASDLAMLRRVKRHVALDDFLDFGPWWYAPALATMVGGLTLLGQEFAGGWKAVYGLVGGLAAVGVSAHDYRRRRVRPRGSAIGAAIGAAIVITCWIVIALWGTAISSVGYDVFLPGYALLAWVLTAIFFLGVRAAFGAVRRRRGPVA